MSIKPVLVPDHDAASLRALMESFDAAANPATPEQQAAAIRKQLSESAESDVAEAGKPDVMRHTGDKTVRVVKKGGKPVGEIGIDAGPGGNGDYYVKLYDGSYDAAGFDTAEEALEELRYAVKQMSEGDPKPVTTGHFADKKYTDKGLPKPYPRLKNISTGKVRAHPNDPDQGVAEGFMDTVKQAFNDAVVGHPMGTSDEQFIKSWARDIRDRTGRDIPVEKLAKLYQDYTRRSPDVMQSHGTTNEESAERLAEFAPPDSGDGGGDDDGFDEDTLRKLAAQWFNGDEDPQVERLLAAAGWEIGQDEGYDDEPGVFVVMSGDDDGRSYMSWPAEELRSDVAEARPDVMRHKGDQTVRVVKKGGKPIGEIGIDAEASPGNGQYYVKLYDGSYDAVGFDSAEEALAELKYAIKSAGSGPDTSFGGPSGWTGPVKEQQVDELSPKTLGSYIKKSSADAAARQGEVSGRNQFGKGAEFAVKAFYGDKIQPHPQRNDPKIAKRQAGVDQAVDRLTAEDIAEGIDPVEQLRADIRRFAQ